MGVHDDAKPKRGGGDAQREAWLDGFTISEFDPSKLFAAALVDQARKHRKRPPDEQ